MTLTLPIYYTQEFKRKPPKTWLVGDNAYRNWHFYLKNEVKKYYHALVREQVTNIETVDQFRLLLHIYLKNVNSDPSNVASRMEKFVLDALQECNIIINDNSKYHLSTTWEFIEIDKKNPRCIVYIQPNNLQEND